MKHHKKLVVMGVSTGGLEALKTVFSMLPDDFSIPVIVVQHRGREYGNFMCRYLNSFCRPHVKEAEDKEAIKPGHIYIAPRDYHLLVEMDRTLSLSVDFQVNFSRPSIDVLFETAAEAYTDRLIGIIMTGANKDGSLGLKKIMQLGGKVIVQDPETAVAPQMPLAAIEEAKADCILPLEGIGKLLAELTP